LSNRQIDARFAKRIVAAARRGGLEFLHPQSPAVAGIARSAVLSAIQPYQPDAVSEATDKINRPADNMARWLASVDGNGALPIN
jgi:hypothetical protein